MPSVMKCQFCSSKLADGEAPACASVCPTNALMFGNREAKHTEEQAGSKQCIHWRFTKRQTSCPSFCTLICCTVVQVLLSNFTSSPWAFSNPFDIPKYEWEKVMPSVMKCQFCSSKLADGEAPGPCQCTYCKNRQCETGETVNIFWNWFFRQIGVWPWIVRRMPLLHDRLSVRYSKIRMGKGNAICHEVSLSYAVR